MSFFVFLFVFLPVCLADNSRLRLVIEPTKLGNTAKKLITAWDNWYASGPCHELQMELYTFKPNAFLYLWFGGVIHTPQAIMGAEVSANNLFFASIKCKNGSATIEIIGLKAQELIKKLSNVQRIVKIVDVWGKDCPNERFAGIKRSFVVLHEMRIVNITRQNFCEKDFAESKCVL